MLKEGVAWATLRCRSSAFLKVSPRTHPPCPAPLSSLHSSRSILVTRTREGLGWSHQPSDFLLVLGDGPRCGRKLLPQ